MPMTQAETIFATTYSQGGIGEESRRLSVPSSFSVRISRMKISTMNSMNRMAMPGRITEKIVVGVTEILWSPFSF